MSQSTPLRYLIPANGAPIVEIDRPIGVREICALLGADTLDTVNLRQGGRVMFVDDAGHEKALPYNAEATRLYHSICKPGTTHFIAGDAIVTLDEDFA